VKKTAKIIVISFVLLLVGNRLLAQAVFDTLYLKELEIFGFKEDHQSSFKETEIDTLVRKYFEHDDLGQLLTAFSPVFIKSYGKGSLASASFRGTAASHTQVLWNGFSINSPMLGQVDFSYIPESFFDEVKLLYGGGSLYEQSGALGGMIMLNNFAEKEKENWLHVNQSIGSFGAYNTAAQLSLNKGEVFSKTSLMLQTAQNDFKYYNNGVLPPEWMLQQNASFLNTGFQQHLSWQADVNNRLDFISWNQWNQRNIPPIMTNVYKGGDPQEYQNDFFSRNILSWKFNKGRHHLSVKTAYFFEDQHYFLKTTTDDSTVVTQVDSKNRSYGYYVKSAYDYELSEHCDVKVGIDLQHDKVKSNNYEKDRTRMTYSFYGGLKKGWWDERLSLDLLIRMDLVAKRVLPVMPFVGFNVKLTDEQPLYLRFNFTRNYHLPSLNDLYWYPGGNPDLEPEDALEFDADLTYRREFSKTLGASIELSVYKSFINNWIQWKPSDYRFWTPFNIGYVISRGMELSMRIYGSIGKVSYRLSGHYALTKTTDESDEAKEKGYDGRQMIYIPVHHGNGFFHLTYQFWNFGWTTIITGERNTTTNPTEDYSHTLSAFTVNNLQIGRQFLFNRWEMSLQFKLNNIFNVQYQSVLWRAMPGTNVEFSVGIDLK